MTVDAPAKEPSGTGGKRNPEALLPSGVSTAFTIGWHVAELYHIERLPGERESVGSDSLPGIGSLPRKDRAHLLSMQIASALDKLGQKESGLSEITELVTEEPINADALKLCVRRFHELLLKQFTARDSRLGKAYGLGRSLAESLLVPTTQDPKSIAKQFGVHRIRTLQTQLADLRGLLPRYCGQAVELSLDSWVSWAEGLDAGANEEWTTSQKRNVGQSLRRQGEVWYGLLSGDIDPLHMLRFEDYISAAEALVAWIGKLAWSFLTSNRTGRVLGAAVAVLSLLVLGISLTGHLTATIGTIVLLLGALGITIGGVASSVREALRQAQAPLWEGELIRAIAGTALCLPNLALKETGTPTQDASTSTTQYTATDAPDSTGTSTESSIAYAKEGDSDSF